MDNARGFSGLGPLGTSYEPLVDDQIRNVLIDYGYHFSKTDEGAFRFSIRTPWQVDHLAGLKIFETERAVTYWVAASLSLPVHLRGRVIEIVGRLNEHVVLGAVSFDFEANSVYFRNGAIIDHSVDVERLLDSAVLPLDWLRVAIGLIDSPLSAREVVDVALLSTECVRPRGTLSKHAMKEFLKLI